MTEYLWAEAGVYSVVSLGLAYCGWFRKPQETLQESRASVTNMAEQTAPSPKESH
jgi:hypothetical protein